MKSKNDQIKVKTNKDALLKREQKEQTKKIWMKKIARDNDNDLKSLKPWNTLWDYKSFSFITESHILIICI
jgi:hypothetical protein